MILILQKLSGTNLWSYPDENGKFSNHIVDGDFMYAEYSGALSLSELSANVDYSVSEFLGILPGLPEKLIKSKDILQKMPLGTKRKLEAIKNNADYADPEAAGHGDTADLLLAIIQSGDAINVNSGNFDSLMGWMIFQEILTQEDVDSLKLLI